MADELQALLDRIRSEGVEKAGAEAKSITDKARAEAADIRKAAEADAEKLRAEAKRDADAFAARAKATVAQAMRDARLQLAEDLQHLAVKFLQADVKAAFSDGATLKSLISMAVEAYLKDGEKGVEIKLGGSAAALAAAVKGEIAAKAAQGVAVTESPAFPEGFTIKTDGGRVEQCFTAEAVTDALARLLRPELAALLK